MLQKAVQMLSLDANNSIQDPSRLDVALAGEAFDRLTRLAAELLETPLALICLADAGRAFYQSVYGSLSAAAQQGSRVDEWLSRRALDAGGPVAVGDLAREEERGSLVPPFGARSYLAAPLRVRGTSVGSLIALDVRPRQWSESDIEVIEQLARSAAQEIELRLTVEKARARRERPRTDAGGKRGLIVIAEDDDSMRRLIVHALESDGYDIREARNGYETLELLGQSDVDVLILDLIMPNLSGWEVLEHRAKDERLRNLPVIVVSARRGPDAARAVAYGIYGLLPKPFDTADLRDLVKTCYMERRARQRVAAG